jgi:hypothetical protein
MQGWRFRTVDRASSIHTYPHWHALVVFAVIMYTEIGQALVDRTHQLQMQYDVLASNYEAAVCPLLFPIWVHSILWWVA